MLETDILIPCKRLREGKSRLAALLSADERFELCDGLLIRTLALATEVARRDRIWLATADALAAERAAARGISVIADEANDLNGALDSARRYIAGRGGIPEALLVLPIDLVLANAAAVNSATAGNYEVVLATDTKRLGTNLLLLRGHAVAAFPFCFGANSLLRHRNAARRAGHSLNIIDNPALAFDLDEQDDYLRAIHMARLPVREKA
jgi:2-phospho-L-lactate guanylyltransferase